MLLLYTPLILGILGTSFPTGNGATSFQRYQSFGERIPAPENNPQTENEAPDGSSHIQGPFLPFSNLGAPAGPIRPDGTYKSRVPEDTLPAGPKDTYTTLDKMQKGATKRGRKWPLKKIRGSLGGLDPQEVYYADEDLIIIKGGGFQNPTYDEPPQEITEEGTEEGSRGAIPFSSSGNFLSPHEEYNGNIPSFLPPPSATRYSPLSLFLPSSYFPQSQTSNRYVYAPPPQGLNSQTSNRYMYVTPPQGIRKNAKYYCYDGPYRGWHPVVYSRTHPRGSYKIHPNANRNQSNANRIQPNANRFQSNFNRIQPNANRFQSNSNRIQTNRNRFKSNFNRIEPNKNRIQPRPYQKIQKFPQSHRLPQNKFSTIQVAENPQKLTPVPERYEEVEQFEGTEPYRPRVQSLVGDTRVNFLEPRPSINPDAEIVETTRFQKPKL